MNTTMPVQLLLTLQALIETLNILQTHVAPCVWNGTELLSHLQNHARLLPTGCVRYVAIEHQYTYAYLTVCMGLLAHECWHLWMPAFRMH